MSKQSRWIKYGREGPGYKWWQTETEVTVTVPMGAPVKGRDIARSLKPNSLQVGIKGKPLIIDGELSHSAVVDESSWTLDEGNVEITIQKATNETVWWASLIKGHPKIDVQRIESGKYLDDSILKKLWDKDEEEEKLRQEEEKKKQEEGNKEEEKTQ